MTGTSEQTGTDQQISDLQTQVKNLAEENRTLKAAQGEVQTFHNTISQHVADKSKLIREKTELMNSFEEFKNTSKAKELDLHLTTALAGAKAKNPTVVRKLIDQAAVEYDENGGVKQESIAALISKIKETDPYMFEEENVDPKKPTTTSTVITNGQLPKPHHVADKQSKSAFETEMDAAVASGDQKQVDAVFAKYHQKA
jgi:Phage minor structural protein GP20